MTWIQTFSGKKFSLIDPQPEDVDIQDVMVALAKMVRFTGHCHGLYTVAQHSVHVAELVPPELRYDALLHDAPEAYYGDLTRPIKHILYRLTNGALKQFLEKIDFVVCDALGVRRGENPTIKMADNVMLATEARDLMDDRPVASTPLPPPRPEVICVWSPVESLKRFTAGYHDLRPKP